MILSFLCGTLTGRDHSRYYVSIPYPDSFLLLVSFFLSPLKKLFFLLHFPFLFLFFPCLHFYSYSIFLLHFSAVRRWWFYINAFGNQTTYGIPWKSLLISWGLEMESRPVNWTDSFDRPCPTCVSSTFSPWPEVPDAASHLTCNLEKGLCTAVRLVLFSGSCAHRGYSKQSSALPGASHGSFMYFVQCQESHALGHSGCCDDTAGLGAGHCWKRVVVPFSAPASLAMGPCCFPCATGALLISEWVSSGDGTAENHIKNEWVFLMRERGEVEISVLLFETAGFQVQQHCALGYSTKAVYMSLKCLWRGSTQWSSPAPSEISCWLQWLRI